MANNTTTDMKELDRILEKVSGGNGSGSQGSGPKDSDLIPILQQIQETYGYLQKDVMVETSKRTGIPASRIYGVATFYEQFHFEPHGKHTVRCCRGTACHVKGGPEIVEAIKRNLNIEPGQTSEDMLFTFETVACLGCCFLAPVMMIDDKYYGHLTASKAAKILDGYSSGKNK